MISLFSVYQQTERKKTDRRQALGRCILGDSLSVARRNRGDDTEFHRHIPRACLSESGEQSLGKQDYLADSVYSVRLGDGHLHLPLCTQYSSDRRINLGDGIALDKKSQAYKADYRSGLRGLYDL